MYTVGYDNYYQTAYDENGYGGVQWYSSSTCGYQFGGDDHYYQDHSGCINDYNQSEIKYIVDAWAIGISATDNLVEDELGYKARLIAIDDLVNNLGYSLKEGSLTYSSNNGLTPDWVYGSYWYWTMSAGDEKEYVYIVEYEKSATYTVSMGQPMVIRPVITLKKSAI